jgi:hypothetical protein
MLRPVFCRLLAMSRCVCCQQPWGATGQRSPTALGLVVCTTRFRLVSCITPDLQEFPGPACCMQPTTQTPLSQGSDLGVRLLHLFQLVQRGSGSLRLLVATVAQVSVLQVRLLHLVQLVADTCNTCNHKATPAPVGAFSSSSCIRMRTYSYSEMAAKKGYHLQIHCLQPLASFLLISHVRDLLHKTSVPDT